MLHNDALDAYVKANPSTLVKVLAQQFGVSDSRISNHLKQVGKLKN